ncbi:MAG: divalent-cation tolerance protein CutA [Deltaproteobacteria bacterium]|nr:divalent-cation tolerance protein CutA [Deltaproteobacteria bacterium]
MKSSIVILITASSKEEARTLARDLVETRLAACANLLPGVQSLFHWNGKVEEAEEVLLILKSRAELFERIEARVRKLHSYEVPEIIALPILNGSAPYLAWIDAETGGSG